MYQVFKVDISAKCKYINDKSQLNVSFIWLSYVQRHQVIDCTLYTYVTPQNKRNENVYAVKQSLLVSLINTGLLKSHVLDPSIKLWTSALAMLKYTASVVKSTWYLQCRHMRIHTNHHGLKTVNIIPMPLDIICNKNSGMPLIIYITLGLTV